MKLLFLNCLFQAGARRVCHVLRGHEWHDLGNYDDDEAKRLAIQLRLPLIRMRRGRMRVDLDTLFTVPRRMGQTFVFDEFVSSNTLWHETRAHAERLVTARY